MEFFTPRCQFRQLFIGHIFTRSVLQQKFKISVDVQPMCFGHLNHCVNYCAGIRSVHGTAEQPVFSPHCERTDRILTEIIGKAAPPVFQIGFRYITPVENIIHGFIQPGIPDGLLLVKPRPESLQNRFFLLETQLFPLFIITGILFVNGVFHGKQPIAVLDSLYYRLAVVILLPFWNSVDKVSADMCPTGAAPDPRHTVNNGAISESPIWKSFISHKKKPILSSV